MRTFLWVVLTLDLVALLVITSAKLDKFALSEFAFRQQLAEYSGNQAKLFRRLYKNLPNVKVQQKLELIILGSVCVAFFSHLINPPALGVAYSLIAFLVIGLISQLRLMQTLGLKMFEKFLEFILLIVETFRPVLRIFSSDESYQSALPGSLNEFTDQLRRLPSTVLSPVQRQRLESILAAEEKTVKDIMTPKKRAVVVEPSATLGPIVLSDLQKTSHGYFPVATKKGEPEGILTLGDVADLELAKQRSSVRDLMSPHIAWVEEDTSLFELARAFLDEKQYIVLVRNVEAEFCGLVTIADLMKHLLGIVKE